MAQNKANLERLVAWVTKAHKDKLRKAAKGGSVGAIIRKLIDSLK